MSIKASYWSQNSFVQRLQAVVVTCVLVSYHSALQAQTLEKPATESKQTQPTPALVSADEPRLRLQMSPYTIHFNPKTEHRPVRLVGLEREFANGAVDGFALFSNSFGQDSFYLYPWGGIYKDIWGVNGLSFKWTAGMIYGYKPPYQNKVPLNYKGFSPGLIFGLGYQFTPRWSGQLNWLGTAGIMFGINAELN